MLAATLTVAVLGLAAAAPARAADSDGDRLSDRGERKHRTNPRAWDTDGDLIADGTEVRLFRTNPRRWDTDRDGLFDGLEAWVYRTSPRRRDTDRDRLADGMEAWVHGTDARRRDTDRDRLSDGAEVRRFRTDPRRRDTDRDRLSDGAEVRRYRTRPRRRDTDRDRLSDGLEVRLFRTNPRRRDTDRDGLSDATEIWVHGSNPRRGDTDRDGVGDGREVRRGRDPLGGRRGPPSEPAPGDATAPDTRIDSGPMGSSRSTSAGFGFGSPERGVSFECRLDATAFTACSSPHSYHGLSSGWHTFEVRARDAAGNVDPSPATHTWSISPSGGEPGARAQRADALVDSVGVNVHLNYYNTAYAKYPQIIRPRLLELGSRHIRDGVTIGNTDKINKLRDLRRRGIRSILIADTVNHSATAVKDWIKRAGSAVWAVEGPNEYNSKGGDWVTRLRTMQTDIYRALRNDPATARLPVACPSLTNREAHEALGNLTSRCQYGNAHNYYGGHHPGTPGWGSCKYGSCYGSLEHNLAVARLNVPGKPVLSTETGWHNAVPSNTTHPGTPPTLVGRYMPRLFLRHLQRGIPRSYPYELIDQWHAPGDAERSFGLLRHDGTPKPSFHAIKAMIRLLRDPGPAFTPAALEYGVRGNRANLETALLQKRNGSFYLAIWQEVAGGDVDANTVRHVTPRPVSISIPRRYSSVTVHALNDSGHMSSSRRSVAGSLPLSVTDRVTFVQLTPPRPPIPPSAPFAGCPSAPPTAIYGTGSGDTFGGTLGADRIFSGRGDDVVRALAGDDCVDLGRGSDLVRGGRGRDLLVGGSGRDRVGGNSGNDRLSGDRGNDRVYGDSGRDRLGGGPGKDLLSGGSGNDRISARDRRRDRIDCGRGRDRVTADRVDRVARNCERVRRRR